MRWILFFFFSPLDRLCTHTVPGIHVDTIRMCVQLAAKTLNYMQMSSNIFCLFQLFQLWPTLIKTLQNKHKTKRCRQSRDMMPWFVYHASMTFMSLLQLLKLRNLREKRSVLNPLLWVPGTVQNKNPLKHQKNSMYVTMHRDLQRNRNQSSFALIAVTRPKLSLYCRGLLTSM